MNTRGKHPTEDQRATTRREEEGGRSFIGSETWKPRKKEGTYPVYRGGEKKGPFIPNAERKGWLETRPGERGVRGAAKSAVEKRRNIPDA